MQLQVVSLSPGPLHSQFLTCTLHPSSQQFLHKACEQVAASGATATKVNRAQFLYLVDRDECLQVCRVVGLAAPLWLCCGAHVTPLRDSLAHAPAGLPLACVRDV